ncbi:hypothetical protein ACWEPC_16215 [Nonomuraea sp. NPDC004297]
MAADYYCAETENGRRLDDPSEDTLFMVIGELDHADNTFVIIQPDSDDPAWYASVALRDDGAHEVEHRDVLRREHQLTTQTDRSAVAKTLTIWLAARDYPDRPVRTPTTDF